MKREASAAGRWARFCIAALIGLSAPRLAEAACNAGGPDFGQLLPNCNGGYCYVVSPGLHTSETLAGTFWSFGSGNPAVGTGTDSGGWSLERYETELAALREAMQRDALVAVGEPRWARYNSPFSLPFMRRNEIWLEIGVQR